ncbi:MAG TPA: histidinol-phosphate transaminase [Puia sp.]|nr:histidinol-phosphate transaminase [Puia sp.]
MGNTISRRALLQRGALLAGGLPFAGSLLNPMQAAPSVNGHALTATSSEEWSEKDIALASVEPLKARLFANENPFGPSDKAKKAIVETLPIAYQYPFTSIGEMTAKIAAFEKISERNILMAAGSTPLLMAAALAYYRPGCNVVSGDPTYADLPSRAARIGAKWVKVPVTADHKLDLGAMEKAVDGNTVIVYICNPNNPTATVVDNEELRGFVDRVSKRTVVFIDEAYVDYLPDPQGATLIRMANSNPNIIVARTFSKLYGFAGLRLGYVVTQPDAIGKLTAYTEAAFSISTTTIHAAIATFQDRESLDAALQKTVASKTYLYGVLEKAGYEYIPSVANFVLFPIRMDGKKFVDEMMNRSVAVRFWKFNNQDWCRVSIGRMDEMEAFAAAFKDIA